MVTGTLEPVSRRETYIETLEMIDDDTGQPINLSGATIIVEIRIGSVTHDGYDNGSYYYDTTCQPFLSADLTSGVTIPALGVLQWRFNDLSRLPNGPAHVAVLISRDGATSEVMNAILPVED